MVSNEIENFSLPHSTPPYVVTAGVSFFICTTNHHDSQLCTLFTRFMHTAVSDK